MKMKILSIGKTLAITFFLLEGCSSPEKKVECDSYDCRRKNITIRVNPNVIKLGESSTLEVKRVKYYLPKMRVFIGDFIDDTLPEEGDLQFFEGSDSLASVVLQPETAGVKKIKGIIEEYQPITEDSVDSYHYPFEIELTVIDTLARIQT